MDFAGRSDEGSGRLLRFLGGPWAVVGGRLGWGGGNVRGARLGGERFSEPGTKPWLGEGIKAVPRPRVR